jgi:glycerol-3-phosphate acyltransferase PlsY
VLLVRLFGPAHGLGDGAVALVALAAFLGHLWPVFFRFEGGKGVATAGGAMLGIEPWLGLATIGVWIAVAALWRYSSLASLAAAVFAPLFRLLVWGGGPIAAAVAAISLLLVWRHAANISRLLAGTESKLGAKRAAGAAQRPH